MTEAKWVLKIATLNYKRSKMNKVLINKIQQKKVKLQHRTA